MHGSYGSPIKPVNRYPFLPEIIGEDPRTQSVSVHVNFVVQWVLSLADQVWSFLHLFCHTLMYVNQRQCMTTPDSVRTHVPQLTQKWGVKKTSLFIKTLGWVGPKQVNKRNGREQCPSGKRVHLRFARKGIFLYLQAFAHMIIFEDIFALIA